MSGYTKLFSSIIASTVWRTNNETRLVWITLLAMSDRKGIVEGSIPGLADLARIPVAACRKALSELESPDPDSRSKEHEGRRILEVDGGWFIVNHGKYRAKMSADDRREYLRQKKAESRDRQRSVNTRQQMSRLSTHTDPAPDPDPTPKAKSAESKVNISLAPLAARPQSNHHKSLIGTHTKCPEGTWAACARGLCVPTKLYAEWRAQFTDTTEASEQIVALVDRAVAELGDGPVGDTPYDFWRAVWRARHASRAPFAPSPHTKGNQTVASMQRVLAKLKAEQA